MGALTLVVNGTQRRVEAPPEESLLSVLRNRLGLTGTKYGCGEGQCGACTVLLDGRAVALLPHAGLGGGGQEDHDHRGAGGERPAPSRPGGLPRRRGVSVRLLHARHDLSAAGLLAANRNPSEEEIVGPHERQHLPLRDLSADPGRGQAGGAGDAEGVRRRTRGPIPISISSWPSTRSKAGCTGSTWIAARFLKVLGGGMLVCLAAPSSDGAGIRPRARRAGAPEGPRGLAAHRRGRARHGLHRQGRDGAEHPHVARAAGRRRAARAGRVDPHGHGRHGPRSVGRGHIRQPHDADDGAAAAPRRGGGARAAGGPRGGAMEGRPRGACTPRPGRSRIPRRERRSVTAS